MQKTILFTVTTDLVYDQRMQRICDSLSENYHVKLIGRVKSNSPDLKDRNFEQKRIKTIFENGKFFYIEYNIRLMFYLLFQKFDLICSIDTDTIIPGYCIAKLNGKPFVFDAHEYFTQVIEVVKRPKIQKLWRAIEDWIIPKTKYAYTVNDSLAKMYFDDYGTTFSVIKNAALLEEISPTESNPLPYLIYVGAVNAGRGLEESIEAMKHIDFNLKICGDGDVLEELKAKVIQLELQDKIEFTGYLVPEELKKITKGAHAGILLLQNTGLSYYYSLANKFYDYVHAEIPQITVNFPEYVTMNNEYKVALLIDLEEKQIIDAFKKIITDKEFYAELKNNCIAAKQHWNWSKEEQKLREFYKNIL